MWKRGRQDGEGLLHEDGQRRRCLNRPKERPCWWNFENLAAGTEKSCWENNRKQVEYFRDMKGVQCFPLPQEFPFDFAVNGSFEVFEQIK